MALAEAGDWLKVEWHYPPDSSSSSSANPKGGSLHSPTGPSTGWCLARDADHRIEFLVEDHPSDVGGAGAGVGDEGAQHHGQEWGEEEERGEGSGSDEIEELIYELRDEAGDLYYFNSATGVRVLTAFIDLLSWFHCIFSLFSFLFFRPFYVFGTCASDSLCVLTACLLCFFCFFFVFLTTAGEQLGATGMD